MDHCQPQHLKIIITLIMIVSNIDVSYNWVLPFENAGTETILLATQHQSSMSTVVLTININARMSQ
jgi:hypothetical protein